MIAGPVVQAAAAAAPRANAGATVWGTP